MFNFFTKKVDVLNHWIAFVDGFQLSCTEFYSALKTELQNHQVPKMEMSNITFAEGGLLSEKRVYLRMLRERIVFDVCASPFGTGFFFSCRTAEIPIALKLWQLLAVIGFIFFGLWLAIKVFGFFLGIVILILSIAVGVYVLRNLIRLGLQDVDQMLTRSPLIGSVYDVFFRKETYYRIDSRLCYVHLVPKIVQELAEHFTAEKGIKLVDQYELSPILGDLYKRKSPLKAPEMDLVHSNPRLSM